MADLNLSLANGKIVKDYSKKFYLVQPQKYPSVSYALAKMGAILKEDFIRCGDKDPLPDFARIDNSPAGYDDAATSIVMDNVTGVRAGMIGIVELSREGIMVTAVGAATKTLTVTRAIFGVAAAIPHGTVITWLSTPMQEGWPASDLSARMRLAVERTNYIQRFVEPVNWTGTMEAVTDNGGLQFQQTKPVLRQDAQDLLKRDLNVSLLLGVGLTLPGTRGPITVSSGILGTSYYQDHTAMDITNRAALEALVRDPLKYGGPEMLAPCSPVAFSAMQYLYQANNIGDFSGGVLKEVGVDVGLIRTPWGRIRPYVDWTLVDAWDNVNSRWLGKFELWNPDLVRFRPLRRIGRYALPKDGDNATEVIGCEGGWEFDCTKALFVKTGVIAPA